LGMLHDESASVKDRPYQPRPNTTCAGFTPAPHQLEVVLDIRQICVRADEGPRKPLARVPDAVDIIAHDVEPADATRHGWQVKVLQVPERRGYREADAARPQRRPQLRKEDGVVGKVGCHAAAVLGAGVLPVQVHAVEAVRGPFL
jgi:hypothetical protein